MFSQKEKFSEEKVLLSDARMTLFPFVCYKAGRKKSVRVAGLTRRRSASLKTLFYVKTVQWKWEGQLEILSGRYLVGRRELQV
jgi:uncharacterized protein with WD repeat